MCWVARHGGRARQADEHTHAGLNDRLYTGINQPNMHVRMLLSHHPPTHPPTHTTYTTDLLGGHGDAAAGVGSGGRGHKSRSRGQEAGKGEKGQAGHV